MAHPEGMTGLHLRPNAIKGKPVFLLVDFGPKGTITSPVIIKTLNPAEAQEFLNHMNLMAERIAAEVVAFMVNDA